MAKRYSVLDIKDLDAKFRDLLDDKMWSYVVVEPSLAARRNLINYMRKAGCENVIEAKDGMEGLMKCKEIGSTVTAIVDLKAPVLNGADFLRHFKAAPELADAKVILTGTDGRKELIVAVFRAGANAYMKKPFPPETLIEKLKSLGAM
jgi:two-component system chemotaxis response regulator CheY